jgi:hypothetical protein
MRWALSHLANLIRDTHYSLSRTYGYTVDVYQFVSNSRDLKTGSQKRVATKVSAKGILVLDARELTQRVHDIGAFSAKTRAFIIPKKYINDPHAKNYWLVFNEQCYEIDQVFEYGANDAFIIKASMVRGKEFFQIFEKVVSQILIFTESDQPPGEMLSFNQSVDVELIHGHSQTEGVMEFFALIQSIEVAHYFGVFRPWIETRRIRPDGRTMGN